MDDSACSPVWGPGQAALHDADRPAAPTIFDAESMALLRRRRVPRWLCSLLTDSTEPIAGRRPSPPLVMSTRLALAGTVSDDVRPSSADATPAERTRGPQPAPAPRSAGAMADTWLSTRRGARITCSVQRRTAGPQCARPPVMTGRPGRRWPELRLDHSAGQRAVAGRCGTQRPRSAQTQGPGRRSAVPGADSELKSGHLTEQPHDRTGRVTRRRRSHAALDASPSPVPSGSVRMFSTRYLRPTTTLFHSHCPPCRAGQLPLPAAPRTLH